MRGGEPEVVVTAEPATATIGDESFVNIEADGAADAATASTGDHRGAAVRLDG